MFTAGTGWLSGPPGGRAGGGGFDQVRFRYRVVAEPGLDRSGESVGGELRDDLMVGLGEVRVGGAGDDRQAAVGEAADQRLVHSAVGWIVQGIPVYSKEPLDVIGDVADGEAHYLLGGVPALGPACLLQALA